MTLRERIWTPGDIKSLAGGAQDALLPIQRAIQKRAIDVDGAVGWGQYLDDVHYSPDQWGLLGTSAGFQVLARAKNDGRPAPELDGAERLLPLDVSDENALHPAVAVKAADPKYDLQNIFRLAAIAEARGAAQAGTNPIGEWPQIVGLIFGLAEDSHWHPRSAIPGGQGQGGEAVTTAFVLHALRRYESPDHLFNEYRAWLAHQLLNDSKLRARPDYVALVGLALDPAAPVPHVDQEEVQALARCRQELLTWRKSERSLVINRPQFEGYQLGTTTDYLMLNPEVMAALFFLRRGNPKPARKFVANTTREVVRNVERHDGFEGQLGMVPTVDQEWAARLCHLFMATYRDSNTQHALRPVRIDTKRLKALSYGGLGLAVAGVLLVAFGLVPGLAFFVAGLVMSTFGLVLGGRDDE